MKPLDFDDKMWRTLADGRGALLDQDIAALYGVSVREVRKVVVRHKHLLGDDVVVLDATERLKFAKEAGCRPADIEIALAGHSALLLAPYFDSKKAQAIHKTIVDAFFVKSFAELTARLSAAKEGV